MPEKQSSGAFDIQPTQPSGGPFDKYLDPTSTATQFDGGQQPSGWGGKASGIAFLGTKLLQGITNGRVKAYANKERERLQTLGNMNQLYEETMQSQIDPQAKEQLQAMHGKLLSGEIQKQLRESGAHKDKGQRGKIASTLGGILEHISGVPSDSKSDPLTVESMSEFMGMLAKAKASAKPASEAYQNNFSLIQQGIEAAKKNVSGKWTTPTREEILNQPQTRQALSWFQQYAPGQMQIASDMLSGYPSQTNLKERAGAEIASGTSRPPSTDKKTGDAGAPPVTGYLQNNYPAAPPKTDAGKKTAAQQEDDEWRQQLSEWAGVQQDVPYVDKNGNMSMVPKKTADSLYRARTVSSGEQRVTDSEDSTAWNRKKWDTTWKEHLKEYEDKRGDKKRDEDRSDARLALARASSQLQSDKYKDYKTDSRVAEEKALNKFIREATDQGHPFKAVAADAENYLKQFGVNQPNYDPEIAEHQAYILKQIASIQNAQNGGSWISMMGGGTAKPAAPPATNKPASKPTTPPATDKIQAAEKDIGLE